MGQTLQNQPREQAERQSAGAQPTMPSVDPERLAAVKREPKLNVDVLGSDLTDAARKAITTRVTEALGQIVANSPEFKDFVDESKSKFHVVSDIRRQYDAFAAQLGLPPAGPDLSGFTLTLQQKDGSVRSLVFIDRSIGMNEVRSLEVLNHEMRHVYQEQTAIAKLKPGEKLDLTTAKRENYAYSETIKDLTRMLAKWKAEGMPGEKIEALQASIALQNKAGTKYFEGR